jgi:2-polyprenyl-3-methyl-5-hydroxy-6-metoxy-1,4-benzoquinol methylase
MRQCPFCRSALKYYTNKQEIDFYRCTRCQSIVAAENIQKYDDNYILERWPLDDDDVVLAKRKSYKDYLDKLGKVKSNLLEVGCGYGIGLEEAEKDGWHVTGLDVSKESCKNARKRIKGSVYCADISHLPQKERNKYDAVVMIDVLDHLTEPDKALMFINRVSKKSAKMVLVTSEAGSWYDRTMAKHWPMLLMEHVAIPSREGITKLLETAGWKVKEITTATKWTNFGIVRNYFSTVNKNVIFKLLSSVVNAVYAKPFKYKIGQMCVVAVKRSDV